MLILQGRKVGLTSLAFSPDGTKLVVCGYRGVVQLWDVGSAKLERSLPNGIWPSAQVFFLDERRLGLSFAGQVRTYNLATGRKWGGILVRGSPYAHSVTFAPD